MSLDLCPSCNAANNTDRKECWRCNFSLAGATGSAGKWTDKDLTWLLGEIDMHSKLKEADNRKLLWLAMNTPMWKHLDMIGVVSAIFTEVENRLYPEYDGETVTFEEWGWRTPTGDIRYLPLNNPAGAPEQKV